MTDDSRSGGVLVLRAWREEGGTLRVRITEATQGEEAELEVSTVTSEAEILDSVRNWLNRIRN